MKYISSFCLAAISLIFLTDCSKTGTQDNGLVFLNNMEAVVGWTVAPAGNLIYDADAHSGKYVCLIDSSSVFGITYNMKLQDVDHSPLKRVKVGAWFKTLRDGADPNLAIDIRDSLGNSIDWFAQNSDNLLKKPGEWEWMEMSIDLTVKNRNAPSNTLRIYPFNKMPAPCLVDDIAVSYEK